MCVCVFCDLELVMLLEWWSGTECTLFTDQATIDKFGKEHVIIILNHNFEIDFLCGWTMTERFGVLGVSGLNIWFCSLELGLGNLTFCFCFVLIQE